MLFVFALEMGRIINPFFTIQTYDLSVNRWQPPSTAGLTTPSSSPSPTNSSKPRTEERRAVPRQQTGWVGKWRLADNPSSASFECKVLDISTRGAGIEVNQIPQLDVGQRIVITAQPMSGASVSVRFTGTIRHIGRRVTQTEFRGGAHGRQFRLGIEFAGLSSEELGVLAALGQFLNMS